MINIHKVRALDDHRLAVEFSDGTKGKADLSELIANYRALARLQNANVFRKASVAHGTVVWPGDIDLSAEAIYALAHGLPHPGTFEQAQANELEMSLRELRRASGQTQADLAAAAGLTQGALSQFERQDDRKLSTLRKYLHALGWNMRLVAVRGGKQVTIRGV